MTVLAVACLLAAPVAAEDAGINLYHFYLPADTYGFYKVDSARNLAQWEVHAWAAFVHANNVLETGRPGDEVVERVLRRQTVLDLRAAVGLWPGLSVGASLPIFLDNDGSRLPDLEHRVRNSGVGVLGLSAKATIVEFRYGYAGTPQEEGEWRVPLLGEEWTDGEPLGADPFEGLDFYLTLKPFLKLNINNGRADDYWNDNNNPTGGAMILASVRYWRFRAGIELGWEFVSSSIDFGDLDIDDRMRWGLGIDFFVLRAHEPPAEEREPDLEPEDGATTDARLETPPDQPGQPHTLSIGGEIWGWLNSRHPFHREREQPVEAMGFIRYRHRMGLFATFGAGAGLNNGIGAPDQRYSLGLGWVF